MPPSAKYYAADYRYFDGGEKMNPGYFVSVHTFSDVMRLWARERLEHEVVVGRELSRGIMTEGLRFQSVEPKRLKSGTALRRNPYIGYVSERSDSPILLRYEVLDHLLAVSEQRTDPNANLLSSLIATREDFQYWLIMTGRLFPNFWFEAQELAYS